MRTFYHSGKIGDIIYSLPTIQAMGGGRLVCGMGKIETAALWPLLIQQDCIEQFIHQDFSDGLPPNFVNLDKFRHHPDLGRRHLVELHAEAQEIPPVTYRGRSWLTIEGKDIKWFNLLGITVGRDYAVVSVTPRYRDHFFNWATELNRLFRLVPYVYFLGSAQEFVSTGMRDYKGGMFKTDRVQYLYTEDLGQAAAIIKYASYFSGTQSALLAIRQGLGMPYSFEQSPNHADTLQGSEIETVLNPRTRRLHAIGVAFKKALQTSKTRPEP